MKTIGIIGHGFVGGAIARGLSLWSNISIYDIDPKKSTHSFEEVCNSDFVFLCLPTPMKKDGSTDLSIIDETCKQISNLNNKNSIYIVKSTVPIGTIDLLCHKYNIKIIHNPEFLTARNADIDFITPSRTILGGDPALTGTVRDFFAERFPGNNIIEMKAKESEAVKYIANTFFAIKVMFFNEAFLGLKEHNIDWDKVMSGVLTDGRIGVSHYQVPGHDGDYGYGGLCFPKDICSFIKQIEEFGFDPLMLKACWEQNLKIRSNRDWENHPSATSKE